MDTQHGPLDRDALRFDSRSSLARLSEVSSSIVLLSVLGKNFFLSTTYTVLLPSTSSPVLAANLPGLPLFEKGTAHYLGMNWGP